jgi:predicted DNA-binding protein with PD1-like motif
MRDKLIHSVGGQRTFAIVLDSGDEAMSCLQRFAAAQHIDAAQITAIGAFRCAELAYFDWENKKYLSNRVDEQVEVAVFAGRR